VHMYAMRIDAGPCLHAGPRSAPTKTSSDATAHGSHLKVCHHGIAHG